MPATRVHRDHRRRLLRRLRHGARRGCVPRPRRAQPRLPRPAELPTGPPASSPAAPGPSSTATATSAARRPAPRQPTRRPCSRAPSTRPPRPPGPSASSRRPSARSARSARVRPTASARRRSGCRSARLGAGLTTIPPIPLVDAAKVVMKNPEVAEDKRTCAKCGSPVGRSKDGRPGRTEGFCPTCGQEFSFTPQAAPRRPGRGAVRGRGLPRPRRPRLDLPRPRQERLGPLGRPQGPAELRRRRRPRRRDRRAALPGRRSSTR